MHVLLLTMQQLVRLAHVGGVRRRGGKRMNDAGVRIRTDMRFQSGKAGVLPLLPPLRTVLESHPSYGSSLPAA